MALITPLAASLAEVAAELVLIHLDHRAVEHLDKEMAAAAEMAADLAD